MLLRGALLCNDAHLEQSGEEGGKRTWRMIGDPTEGALIVASAKAGLWRDDVESSRCHASRRFRSIPIASG